VRAVKCHVWTYPAVQKTPSLPYMAIMLIVLESAHSSVARHVMVTCRHICHDRVFKRWCL